MINVFVLDRYRLTVDNFLEIWARELQPHLRSISYESLLPGAKLTGTTFIFSDLERLTEAQCTRAENLAAKITAAGGRVLNRPARVLRRYDLIRKLHQTAGNPFNAYRESEINGTVRYPVFVRNERAHDGSLTDLLHNAAELTAALAHLKATRRDTSNLLIVEYQDTAHPDEKLFRKYAALLVKGTMVPRHILFSTDWVDKTPDVVTEKSLREEEDFLRHFPHDAQVRKIFEIAGIDYGRIDYSILGGQLVTWEINTNPTLLPMPEDTDPGRMPSQLASAKAIIAALRALPDDKPVTVRITGSERVLRRGDIPFTDRLVTTAAGLLAKFQHRPAGERLTNALAILIRQARDQGPPRRRF